MIVCVWNKLPINADKISTCGSLIQKSQNCLITTLCSLWQKTVTCQCEMRFHDFVAGLKSFTCTFIHALLLKTQLETDGISLKIKKPSPLELLYYQRPTGTGSTP